MVEGLAYLGLCLTRNHSEEPRSNPHSVTRQKQFDFNEIQDRDYKYFVATNDDGWLVGGFSILLSNITFGDFYAAELFVFRRRRECGVVQVTQP